MRGIGRAIAADPHDTSRLYATLDKYAACLTTDNASANGVFTSTDAGKTWAATVHQAPGPLSVDQLQNAKLSVSADGSRVWSAILKNGQAYSIAFSDDTGDAGLSWTMYKFRFQT